MDTLQEKGLIENRTIGFYEAGPQDLALHIGEGLSAEIPTTSFKQINPTPSYSSHVIWGSKMSAYRVAG
jgi:hypothetical protein